MKADRRQLLLALAAGTAGVLAGCRDDATATAAKKSGVVGANKAKGAPKPPAPQPPPIPPPHPGAPEVVFELPQKARIALTIDDGFSTRTVAAYVQFAEDSGIPLTFSPNGTYRAVWEPHAPVLRPLVARGQVQIANHTYSHASMTASGDTRIRREINRNEDWIQQTFGTTSRPWFRPPYGYHNKRTDEVAGELGFTRILMWNGTLGDSSTVSAATLLAEARRYMVPGTVLLGHANHPTVTHLYAELVQLIRDRNLQPGTLDQLFGTSRAQG